MILYRDLIAATLTKVGHLAAYEAGATKMQGGESVKG